MNINKDLIDNNIKRAKALTVIVAMLYIFGWVILNYVVFKTFN
jgi:hypothetical protein